MCGGHFSIFNLFHVIKFFRVDLWVIKIKAYDPLRAQYVEFEWTEHETQITQLEHAIRSFIL